MKRSPAKGWDWELIHARRFIRWARGEVAKRKRQLRRRERHIQQLLDYRALAESRNTEDAAFEAANRARKRDRLIE